MTVPNSETSVRNIKPLFVRSLVRHHERRSETEFEQQRGGQDQPRAGTVEEPPFRKVGDRWRRGGERHHDEQRCWNAAVIIRLEATTVMNDTARVTMAWSPP